MPAVEREVQDAGARDSAYAHEEIEVTRGSATQTVEYLVASYGTSPEKLARGLYKVGRKDDPEVWLAMQQALGMSVTRQVRALLGPALGADLVAEGTSAAASAGPDLARPQVTTPAQATLEEPAAAGGPTATPEQAATPAQEDVPATPDAVSLVDRQVTVLGVRIVAPAGTHLDVIPRTQAFIEQLIGGNEHAQRRFARDRVTIVIIPGDTAMTDMPQFARLRGQQTFDGRDWADVRGSGGMRTSQGWVIGVGEETLVSLDPSRLLPDLDLYPEGFHLGMHELAHTLQDKGLTRRQQRRIRELYERRAKVDPGNAAGTWSDRYAASNDEEYFAQSTNAFFGTNAMGGNGNGREWLRQHDPEMYELLLELYESPRSDAGQARTRGRDG